MVKAQTVTKAPSECNSMLKLAASTKSLTNPSHNPSEASTLEMIDEFPTSTEAQKRTPHQEEEGQELLWIEDKTQISEGQELLYVNNDNGHSILDNKNKTEKKNKKKNPLRSFFFRKAKGPQVAIVPPEDDDAHQLAFKKAEHARQLLQEALSSLDEDDDARDATVNRAFCEAMNARLLFGSNDDDGKWLETKALGEKEAQRAIRSNVNVDQPLSPNSMMEAAEQHAEQARVYLESMLPEFLNEAVSSSDASEEVSAVPIMRKKKRHNLLRNPKSRRKQSPRKREEMIARIVQENNQSMASPAISTLGFDNTFDTKSLGDIMDGPSTTPQSKETLQKVRMMQEKKKQKAEQAKAESRQQLTSPERRRRIEKFVATVVPAESELKLTEADKNKLVEIQELDQLVDGRLSEASKRDDDDDACSLSSYHGVPQHDDKAERRKGKVIPPSAPTFVKTNSKIQPQLLSAQSWEDMADGNASLEDVVHQTHPKKIEKVAKEKKKNRNNKMKPTPSNSNNGKKSKVFDKRFKDKLLSPLSLLRRRKNQKIESETPKPAAESPKRSKYLPKEKSTPTRKSTPNRKSSKVRVPSDVPKTISITPSTTAPHSPPPFSQKRPKPMTSPEDEDRYISLTELQDNDNDEVELSVGPEPDRYYEA